MVKTTTCYNCIVIAFLTFPNFMNSCVTQFTLSSRECVRAKYKDKTENLKIVLMVTPRVRK